VYLYIYICRSTYNDHCFPWLPVEFPFKQSLEWREAEDWKSLLQGQWSTWAFYQYQRPGPSAAGPHGPEVAHVFFLVKRLPFFWSKGWLSTFINSLELGYELGFAIFWRGVDQRKVRLVAVETAREVKESRLCSKSSLTKSTKSTLWIFLMHLLRSLYIYIYICPNSWASSFLHASISLERNT